MRFILFIAALLVLLGIPKREKRLEIQWNNAEEYVDDYAEFVARIDLHYNEMNSQDWVIANQLFREFSRTAYARFAGELSDTELQVVEDCTKDYKRLKTKWNINNWKYKLEDIWLEASS